MRDTAFPRSADAPPTPAVQTWPATPTAGLADVTRPVWLPLHHQPRVGDYVIHQRLEPTGLTPLQRRTEITAVNDQHVVIQRIYGDAAGHVLTRLSWASDKTATRWDRLRHRFIAPR